MSKEVKMVNLGWMNGWDSQGEAGKDKYKLIDACRKAGHTGQERQGSWGCVTTCMCVQCNYVYKIDSSG